MLQLDATLCNDKTTRTDHPATFQHPSSNHSTTSTEPPTTTAKRSHFNWCCEIIRWSNTMSFWWKWPSTVRTFFGEIYEFSLLIYGQSYIFTGMHGGESICFFLLTFLTSFALKWVFFIFLSFSTNDDVFLKA